MAINHPEISSWVLGHEKSLLKQATFHTYIRINMYHQELKFVGKTVQNALKETFLTAYPGITGDINLQNEMRQDNDYQCPDAIRYYNLSKKEGKAEGTLTDFASKIAVSLPEKNDAIQKL